MKPLGVGIPPAGLLITTLLLHLAVRLYRLMVCRYTGGNVTDDDKLVIMDALQYLLAIYKNRQRALMEAIVSSSTTKTIFTTTTHRSLTHHLTPCEHFNMHSQTALLLSLATATIAVPHTMPISKRDGKYTCFLTGWDKRSNEVVFAPADPGSFYNVGLEWGWSINLKDNDLGTEYIYWSPSGDTKAPTASGGVDFKPEDTRLDGTVHYDGSGGNLILDDCSCRYKLESDTSDAEGEVYTGVLYNEENTKCTCEFACEPPQVTHG
jgi:hypothetical protein